MSLTVDKCLQAWTNSLKQMNAKADIVFLGDSLTYYADFSSVIPDKTVCNLGLRGDSIQGMINRTELVRLLKPKQVFLMAGINDVVRLSTEEFGTLYYQLVQEITGMFLCIQSILPVNAQDFEVSCNNDRIKACNTVIERIAKDCGLDYVDLFSLYEERGQLPSVMTIDGIHLTDAAYNKWYRELKKHIV